MNNMYVHWRDRELMQEPPWWNREDNEEEEEKEEERCEYCGQLEYECICDDVEED